MVSLRARGGRHQAVGQPDCGALRAGALGHLVREFRRLLGLELGVQVGEQVVPAHLSTLALAS
jgi:hypothetical protein